MARIEEGRDLTYLLDEKPDADELAYYHSLDISGSVYARMRELGLSRSDLAKRMGVHRSVITRIIKGTENLTLKTIARLEEALDFRLDDGFRYVPSGEVKQSRPYEWDTRSLATGSRAETPTTTDTLTASGLTIMDGGLAA